MNDDIVETECPVCKCVCKAKLQTTGCHSCVLQCLECGVTWREVDE